MEQNQVLHVTLDEGKSLRGLRVGIGRILKTPGINATTWDDDTQFYIARNLS